MKTVDLQTYEKLGAIAHRQLATLAFFGNRMDLKAFKAYLIAETGMDRKAMRVMFEGLVGDKYARLDRGEMERDALTLCVRFTPQTLRRMADEMDEKGWMPTAEKLKAHWQSNLYRYGYYDYGEEHSVEVGLLVGRLVKALVQGTTAKLAKADLQALDDSCAGAQAAAAYRLRALTDGEFKPSPLSALDLVKFDVLAEAWLSIAFVSGRPVGGLLADFARRLANGATMDDLLARTYAAACVWTGFAEGVRALNGRAAKLDSFRQACECVLAGRFAEADRLFRRDENERTSRHYFETLPTAELKLTTTMAVKFAKTRPVALMRACDVIESEDDDISGDERNYAELLGVVRRAWIDSWPQVMEGKGALIGQGRFREASPLTGNLLLAWDWYFLQSGRGRCREAAARSFDFACQFLAAGYVNVTGLMLSLLAGAYDPVHARPYVEAVDARGVWFLPRRDPEPEWKNLVGALEKFLKSRERREAREAAVGGRLMWGLAFGPHYDVKGGLRLESLMPVLRTGTAEEPNYQAQAVRYLRKKAQRQAMTESDLLLEKTFWSSDGYANRATINEETLKLIASLPNLVEVGKRKSGSQSELACTPMRLRMSPCRLSVTTQEDGGVAVQAPRWLKELRYGYEKYVIRKTGEGEYACVTVSTEVLDLAATFEEFGVNGKVVFPGEAMPVAGPVLERLTEVLPVEEPAADSSAAIPRVQAASALTLRLDFAEGVLKVQAVVKPLKDNDQMTLDPGLGPAEKVVIGPLGTYVLVRDVEAERAALARVRAAVAAAETWFDGRNAWTVDDVGAAIETLGALKALEPAVPLEWPQNRRLNASAVSSRGVQLESFRSAGEWFSVKGTARLDDGRVLKVVELLEAMRSRQGNYVRLSDGDYVTLTRTMAQELDALSAVGRRKGDGVEVTRAAIPMLDGVFGQGEESLQLPEAMAQSAAEIRAELAKRPAVPATLSADLRPYQVDGFRWLSRLAACGLGACLADDMGLGKTLQIITLLLERASGGASLVVAPSSVCGNWRRELQRFAPTLSPVVAMETPELAFAMKPRTVVIVSYGYLLFHEADYAAQEWNGVVLDEAQAIKNDASKRARATKRLKAKFRVAATGTPVENRLGELWSLFDFLNPGLLGASASFAQRFTADGRATRELKRTVKPLVLRRLKGDVLADLPEKTEVTIPVVLGEAERSAYEGCRLHALATLAKGEGETNRISILAELTRLRRFCCHPSLVLGEGDVPSAKMEALVDLLEGLKAGAHRALVFSQFTDYLAIVRKVIAAHGWSHKYLDGSTPTAERGRLVEEFQAGEGDFFLISLKAGGTGLNLTAANYVILLDPWWNPAVENQAADRTHRIGQTQPVTVYRLVAEDTVEERVIELHQQKLEMSADLLDGTSNARFSPEDLMKLFKSKGQAPGR